MGKKIRIRIRDEQPGSYFCAQEPFFWVSILKFLMRIRDREWKKLGSRITDKHPRSATTLVVCVYRLSNLPINVNAGMEMDSGFSHSHRKLK
jgi:hypothetical protein